MMNGSTSRYAAIVVGPTHLTPGLSWRRLNRDTRPVLGLPAPSTASRTTLFSTLASKLVAQRPPNLDLSHEIPVLLLPYAPDWRGGLLLDHEIDLVLDNARQLHAPKPAFVSTAIDAIGARLLMRLFYDGFIEVIPFAYANSGFTLRSNQDIDRPAASTANFVYLQTLTIPLQGSSILIDAGRLLDPIALASCRDLQAMASALFWREINPRRGNLFQSVGGIMLQAGGAETDVATAILLSKMALKADPAEDCVLYVQIPTDSSGLARVTGVSSRSTGNTGAPMRSDQGQNAEIIAAAAFALCDRWETHTVLPVHSDPFGIEPAGPLTGRRIRIALDPSDRLNSAHDTLEEFAKLATFWRAARDNPRVRAALAPFPSDAVARLDHLYDPRS